MDVAFDVRRRLQGHSSPPNDTEDRAAHDHARSVDGAGYATLLADDDLGAADVTLNLAIDLQRSLADDLEALADDLQVVADHRLGAWLGCARTLPWLLWRVASGASFGLDRLKRLWLGLRATREHGDPRGLAVKAAIPAPRVDLG